MGTSTGACCGAHRLKSSFTECRLCLIQAVRKDGKRKEDFISGELESDDRLKYAAGFASNEAALQRIQLREIRTLLKTVRPWGSRAQILSGRTSMTLASKKAPASAE